MAEIEPDPSTSFSSEHTMIDSLWQEPDVTGFFPNTFSVQMEILTQVYAPDALESVSSAHNSDGTANDDLAISMQNYLEVKSAVLS